MKTFRFGSVLGLVAVGIAGCSLIKVNGKPLGGGSSSSSSPSSSTSKPSDGEQAEQSVNAPREEKLSDKEQARQNALRASESSSSPTLKPASMTRPTTAAEPGTPGKSLDDIAKAPEKQAAWTPVQQYIQIGKLKQRASYSAVIVADELGSKLSQGGRLATIRVCLKDAKKDASAAVLWAICGADVEAMNLDGFAAELKKEGIDSKERGELLADAKETLDAAKSVGAAVSAAAKDEAGVAAIVAAGAAARKEWQAFASANAELLATLDEVQDIARLNKNGLGGDCVAKTEPAFAKVVRSHKWTEEDVVPSSIENYANQLPTTTESYIAALAWGACAFATHQSGRALYSSVGNTAWGQDNRATRYARRGPRSLTVAKLFQDPFKPTFADRSLNMSSMSKPEGNHVLVGGFFASVTPKTAVIKKLVKDGDNTTISFSSDTVNVCVDWQETSKIAFIMDGGTVVYEKKCMKRDDVYNEHSDVVTGTAFTNGLTPKTEITAVDGFPVVGIKGKKFVAALGIKI